MVGPEIQYSIVSLQTQWHPDSKIKRTPCSDLRQNSRRVIPIDHNYDCFKHGNLEILQKKRESKMHISPKMHKIRTYERHDAFTSRQNEYFWFQLKFMKQWASKNFKDENLRCPYSRNPPFLCLTFFVILGRKSTQFSSKYAFALQSNLYVNHALLSFACLGCEPSMNEGKTWL